MLEYDRLKQTALFTTKKEILLQLLYNVRSCSKHNLNIACDNSSMINNDIIGFTEKQINPSDSSGQKIETLRVFSRLT